jgi:hypothetical protein
MKTRHRQRVFLRKRKKEMPRHYSAAATSETALPIAVRTARFLEDDGSTRVEVYWGGNLTAGAPDADRQVLSASLVRYGPDYKRQQSASAQYVFTTDEKEGARRIAPTPLATTTTTDPFHISIQWDRYEALSRGTDTQLGERTGRQTIRVDTLRRLSANATQLEMSDLRPMVAEGDAPFNPARPAESATPYPFSTLPADATLLLYFKIYHLAPDAQDRTQYEVSYEVRRETNDGGFLGIGGGGVERTETTSSYTGTSRTTTEFIQLDWGDTAPEEPQPVSVTVRATDKVTGQEVERTLNFRLLPPQKPQ